jgi:hypothetical protein
VLPRLLLPLLRLAPLLPLLRLTLPLPEPDDRLTDPDDPDDPDLEVPDVLPLLPDPLRRTALPLDPEDELLRFVGALIRRTPLFDVPDAVRLVVPLRRVTLRPVVPVSAFRVAVPLMLPSLLSLLPCVTRVTEAPFSTDPAVPPLAAPVGLYPVSRTVNPPVSRSPNG